MSYTKSASKNSYIVCMVYKLYMLMSKCLKGLAPAYLVAFCTKGSVVSGRSALRSAVRGDLVVPGHRTDWGIRTFAVAAGSQLLEMEWVAY